MEWIGLTYLAVRDIEIGHFQYLKYNGSDLTGLRSNAKHYHTGQDLDPNREVSAWLL